MDDLEKYRNVITDLIQRQVVMLGPNVALAQVRKVGGLTVDDKGVVTAIDGNPREILSNVSKQYMALSGQIAQLTLEAVVAKYPDLKIGQQ